MQLSQVENCLYRERKLYVKDKFVSFAGNDYLGLSQHPQVIKAAQNALNDYGFGAGASQLISGYTKEHYLLEQELAEFIGAEKVLLFSTGYMANLAVVTALAEPKHNLAIDKFCHASIIDACRLSGSKFKRYLHANINHLEQILAQNKYHFVITEGVFSMSGDIAPLSELTKLTKKFNTTLIVDDAHGIGVLGKKGKGCIEHYNIENPPILVGTFGKAFGGFGAFVAGSKNLIEYLIQFARPLIYTTALPPAIAAANRASLKIIQAETWRREQLTELIAYFRQVAEQLNIKLLDSITPIQVSVIGDAKKALAMGEKLQQAGFLVAVIRPPTVSPKSSRLRISLKVTHTKIQIEQLLTCIKAK